MSTLITNDSPKHAIHGENIIPKKLDNDSSLLVGIASTYADTESIARTIYSFLKEDENCPTKSIPQNQKSRQ